MLLVSINFFPSIALAQHLAMGTNHFHSIIALFARTALHFTFFPVFFIAASGLNSCSNEPEESEFAKRLRLEDSLRIAARQAKARKQAHAKSVADSIPLVQYRTIAITTPRVLDSLRKTFGRANYVAYRAFTTINRKDLRFFKLGDTVVLPSALYEDRRVYSVFPHRYPEADTIAKIILVSNMLQAYACYEYGRLVHFAACNTGSEHKPTFPGRYALNWRDKLRLSSLDSTWKLPWTWNFHLEAGSAFHEFEMPGRPVSHSCIRQFMDDAEWLFKWGKGARIDTTGLRPQYVAYTGTPVIIMDVFDYSRKQGGPWWNISSNRTMLTLPADPMGVEEALIPISQIPEEVRWTLKNKERYLFAEDTLRKRGVIRKGVHLTASINFNKLRREKARLMARKIQEELKQKSNTVQTNSATAEDEALQATFFAPPLEQPTTTIQKTLPSRPLPAVNVKPSSRASSTHKPPGTGQRGSQK
jgi:hypothetical protein